MQLLAREALRHAQQALARFRKVAQRQFTFSRSHLILAS
jgi:hypothetical protein